MAEEINRLDWTEVRRPNPHFFKVLVDDFAKSMKIPPKFHKHLQAEMETNPTQILTAILEGPTGRTCPVKLEPTKKGIFFTSGWTNFAKHHSLKKDDFLIFRYNGCMHFTVLIFDKTACEKEPDFDENEKTTKFGSKRKLSFDEGHTDDNKSDQEDRGDEEEELGERTKNISSRRPVTEEEKNAAQKAAESFASENPFFVTHISRTHLNTELSPKLRFPSEFSKKYLPRFKCEFVLRVANGKTWNLNYNPSVKERDSLSRGWLTFVKGNDLEENDFCVFELVEPTEFEVHFFRVIEA